MELKVTLINVFSLTLKETLTSVKKLFRKCLQNFPQKTCDGVVLTKLFSSEF